MPGDPFCPQCGRMHPCSSPTTTAEGTKGPGGVPWGARRVVLGIALVATAAVIVSQIIVLLVGRENPGVLAWFTSIALGVIIFVTVWLVALRPYRASPAALGLSPPSMPRLKTVGLTVGALSLSLGVTALYAALVRLAGMDILVPPEIPRDIVLSGNRVVLTFLALALWTPLSEEVFFRGFIFAGLSPRWGVTGGMIISAAIFSIFHISLGVLVPIFVTGLLLAWLYRQTGSLWASIVAHAGQNAAALAATIYGV